MPLATVREAIAFAARTRLSKKTKEQKNSKVDSILGKSTLSHVSLNFNSVLFRLT
jgi:ABC-type sulfate/molybdate transport systems ATPase subunit